MTKLPLDSPTEASNIALIRKSLRAEKLGITFPYRILICVGLLLLSSILRTAFQFGFFGTVLVNLPFLLSLPWALLPSWRTSRAKRIPFLVLYQYMTAIPKSIRGQFVRVYGEITYLHITIYHLQSHSSRTAPLCIQF